MNVTLKSLLDFDVALDIIAYLREIAFHAVGILVVDDFQ